jgi:translocator protein
MTVLSHRRSAVDLVRGVVLAVLAVAQVVVSGLGGSGAVGDPVGVVARDYPTPLLAAGWTFAIWGLVYAGFLALAVFALLPAQRSRTVHRDTGWWLVATAVLNPLWIIAFSARLVPLAQLLIVALLVCLAVVFGRLSRVPAESVLERVVFRGTVALYTGWVSLATVLGTAATGVWAGLPGQGPLPAVAAVVVLLVVAAVASWVVTAGTAVVAYSAAVVWALAGIALNGPPTAVAAAAVLGALVVTAAAVRRVSAAAGPVRAAWG